MTQLRKVWIADETTGLTAAVEDIDGQGCLSTCVQDQITEPVDALFSRSLSNFTIAVDTVISTETTLNYDFTATAGHGITVTSPLTELLLLDVVGDRALQARAVNVVGDVITLDRPIDHVYPAATALGRITSSEMAVDGSVTPVIFTFRTGVTAVDVTRILLTGLDSTSMDMSTFGGQAALTRGLVFRIVNGFQKTTFNFKTNREIAQFCFDLNLEAKAPSGQHGLIARITFGGPSKHGVVIRLSGTSVIQWIVQDNLTLQDTLQSSVQGHKINVA